MDLRLPLALGLAAVLGADLAWAQSPAVPAASAAGCSGPSLPGGARKLSQLPGGPLEGLDGQAHRLSDWAGKVLLVNFWAGWCAPCQYEIPDLVAFQTAHRAQGLQVVGVGLDSRERLVNVARSLEINYPVLVAGEGPGAELMASWGNATQTVPYSVVLDARGCIAHLRRGPLDRSDLDDYLLPLLAPGSAGAHPPG